MEPATPEVATPTSETPKTSKDNHLITILSVAVFILFSLSAVAFLYFQNQKLKSMLANYQSPIQSPTSAPTTPTIYLADFKKVDTTGWREVIINKSRYGRKLQFLIPPNASVCDPSESLDGAPIPKSFDHNDVQYVSSEDNSKCLTPTIFIKGEKFPIGTYVEWTAFDDLKKGSTLRKAASYLEYEFSKAEITDFGFGEQETYLASGEASIIYNFDPLNSASDNKTQEIYYERVMFNKGIDVIVLTIQTNPEKTNLDIYRQILSTFKFIELSPSPTAKACTQEAKLCPNGSYVGRTGPNCEFSPCPTP
jgi:hypothetical protein